MCNLDEAAGHWDRATRFALVRVDDRLLHGQVVYGWAQALDPRGYLIVDDEVAGDDWEREAFLSAAPPEVSVGIEAVAEFLSAAAGAARTEASRVIVLLRSVDTLARLYDAGFRPGGGVNLGGLHDRPGTIEYISYLHLTETDRASLLDLLDRGLFLFAQDLPSSPRVAGDGLRRLLRP
jgi:mannose/fructose/N-acetylgalactosamine-specific phosphotransferase system component IIB